MYLCIINVYLKREKKGPYYEISSLFWVNAKNLWAELKKIIDYFEGGI